MNVMQKVLDKLIETAADGAVQVQLIVDGATLAGAVRHAGWDGVYELMAPMQRADRSVAMVRMFIKGEAITLIGTPVEQEEKQIQPVGGLVIPGRR